MKKSKKSTTSVGYEPLTWRTEQRRVSELRKDSKNPRKISPAQAKKLGESFDRFGYVEIIAVNSDNTIIAGHMRHDTLLAQGRGNEMVDVRVPSRPLSLAEQTEYNVRSNLNTGEWDWDKLGEIEQPLLLEAGFTESELSANLPSMGPSREEMDESNPKLAEFIKQREKSRKRGEDKNERIKLMFPMIEAELARQHFRRKQFGHE